MEIEDHLRALLEEIEELKHHLSDDYKCNIAYDDLKKSFNAIKKRFFAERS